MIIRDLGSQVIPTVPVHGIRQIHLDGWHLERPFLTGKVQASALVIGIMYWTGHAATVQRRRCRPDVRAACDWSRIAARKGGICQQYGYAGDGIVGRTMTRK